MKYLGIDFGLRRIGLACSEGSLASPWKIIEVKNYKDSVSRMDSLLKQEQFDKLIVGLPEGKIGKTVIGFINALKKLGYPVEASDETLSSRRAKETMIELGLPQKKRQHDDAYSACLILQNYLDNLV